jgi:hypothetical protein
MGDCISDFPSAGAAGETKVHEFLWELDQENTLNPGIYFLKES